MCIVPYKKITFHQNLTEKQGFKVNPYGPCVANKLVHGKQMTIKWHVDDIMSAQVNKLVNDSFEAWLNKEYGEIAEVKSSRGKIHDYLGMTLDFSIDGQVKIDIVMQKVPALCDDPSQLSYFGVKHHVCGAKTVRRGGFPG